MSQANTHVNTQVNVQTMATDLSTDMSCDASIIVSVNDMPITIVQDAKITDLLQGQDIAASSVALVCNGTVVPKNEWSSRVCIAGDRFEIFALVAGG